MAKLPRKTQKIFGENSPTNQVTAFGSIKEGNVVYSKDVADIQTAAYSEGWAAAVQDDYAPYRQDRNALDLVTSKQLAYQFQEGVPEWDAGTTYYKGGVVKEIVGTEFKLYHSLIDNNVNKPLTDVTSWKMDFDSASPFQTTGNLSQTIDTSTTKYPSNAAVYEATSSKANDSAVVHKAGGETITGQKLISNDGQNSYVINEGNSQLDIYCTNIDSTVVPDSTQYAGITLCDKNGLRMGKLEIALSNSNVGMCSIGVSRMINGAYTNKSLSVRVNAAGEAWVENLRPNYGSLIGLNMTLGTSKKMPNDGVLFINIRVGSQTESTVNVYDGSGHAIGVFKHNGGGAEFNCSTFTAIVARGQSINCSWNNAGNASIISSYLAPWR